VAAFENCHAVTVAKFINKSPFSILPGVICQQKIKLTSEQKLRIYSLPRHIAKPNVECLTSL